MGSNVQKVAYIAHSLLERNAQAVGAPIRRGRHSVLVEDVLAHWLPCSEGALQAGVLGEHL